MSVKLTCPPPGLPGLPSGPMEWRLAVSEHAFPLCSVFLLLRAPPDSRNHQPLNSIGLSHLTKPQLRCHLPDHPLPPEARLVVAVVKNFKRNAMNVLKFFLLRLRSKKLRKCYTRRQI